MKRLSLLRMGALTAAVVSLALPALRADDYDKKTVVTFDQPTQAPGIVLQPGKYVIKLLNSSSNRHIAEIMNERMDHLYALTFTAAAERIRPASKPVLTFYEGKNGQPQAVRQWFWPGDTIGQEFLYPKEQAAKIAAATNERVAEGPLPSVAESGQGLTPDNAKGLSLESRKESEVDSPLAAKAAEPVESPAPVVIAQNTPPPSPRAQPSPAEPSPAVNNSQSNTTTAASPNSTDQTLPQTASYLPLIGVIGLVSLAMAIVIASARRSRLS